VENRKVISFY